jgi:hypothetical protein
MSGATTAATPTALLTPRTSRSVEWPRSTSVLLALVGVLLAATSYVVVLAMPDLPWHGARGLELQSTYETYRETGTLLVKPSGEGSWYTQAPSDTSLTSAAWDDDPGSYIVASLMSHLTGSESPYPGLRWAMAALVALPLLLLPTAVARVFRRARAGYALVVLPAAMWLVNGTVLVGTEYGLVNESAPTRVYALYGFAASTAFASLTLLLYLCTRRLGIRALVAATLVMGVLAGVGNLMRSLSGVGIAAGVGVIWWLHRTGRFRLVQALAAAAVAVALSFAVPTGIMAAVDRDRAVATEQPASLLPKAHGVWHPLYLGLSYPQPITGQPSPFGIPWSDEFGWQKVWSVDDSVLIASAEYDQIIKDFYLDAVQEQTRDAARVYLGKLAYTVKHFSAMIVVVLLGVGLALARPGPHRRPLRAALLLSVPTLALGLVPPVLVMPLLYYFSELAAVLGLLFALGLGALAWVVTSLPSHVRAAERGRIAARLRDLTAHHASAPESLSVVVPTRNGADVVPQTLAVLGRELGPDDEVVVVENGSSDATTEVLERVAAEWTSPARLVVMHSAPGLGVALRAGVLATTKERLLLTADDLPFGLSDLEQFRRLPVETFVAIGSKSHPGSVVERSTRRTVQSRMFRALRGAILHSAVADSQGTFFVDGRWCRMFAAFSREPGLMWTTELVLAAEQQGLPVVEVPVRLQKSHEKVTSRFTPRDALVGLRGLLRLALQKDDYVQDRWLDPDTTRDEVLAARG